LTLHCNHFWKTCKCQGI